MNKTLVGVVWMSLLVGISTLGAAEPLKEKMTPGRFGEALDAATSPAFSEKELPAYSVSPLTVELWCKLNSRDNYNILASHEPKESLTHWEIYTEPGGNLSVYLPGVMPPIIQSAKNLTDGEWHYVAMVFAGENVLLFVDGMEVVNQAVSKNPEGEVVAGPLNIGLTRWEGGTFDCDGAIDEVRISNCARNISGIPDAPFNADAQTIGLWHFDSVPAANAFADSSANANPLLPWR